MEKIGDKIIIIKKSFDNHFKNEISTQSKKPLVRNLTVTLNNFSDIVKIYLFL